MKQMSKIIIIFLSLTFLIAGCGQRENKNLVKAKDSIAKAEYPVAKKEIQLALKAEPQNPEMLGISEILTVMDKRSAADWNTAIEKILGYIKPLNSEIKVLENIEDPDSDQLDRLETLIRQRNSCMGFLARSIAAASQKGEAWVQDLINNSTALLVSAMLEAGKSFEPESRRSVEEIILKMGDLAVDPLIAELKNSDAGIRKQAVLFLGKLRAEKAIAPISELLRNKAEDFDVIYNTSTALEMIGGEGIIEPLRLVLKTNAAQARMHAAMLLGRLKSSISEDLTGKVIADLIMLLADDNTYVQTTAINVLTTYGQPAVQPLLEVLRQGAKNIIPDEPTDIIREGTYIANAYIDADKIKVRRISLQVAAITALGNIKSPVAIEPLINLLDNDDLRASAVAALTTMGSVAVESLINTLTGPPVRSTQTGQRTKSLSNNMRIYAASILGSINDLRAVKPLVSVLDDANRDVRANAAGALGKMKARGEKKNEGFTAVRALTETLAKAKDEKTKNSAIVALGNIAQYDAQAAAELIRIAQASKTERESLRSAAITALVAMKPQEATDAMIKIMLDEEESDVIRKGAVTVLSEIKPKKALPPMLWILSTLYDEPKDFQRHLKREYRTAKGLNQAIEQLNVDWHPDYKTLIEVKPIPSLVRSEVAIAFGKIKGDKVIEPLIRALKDDKRAVVRKSAAWALGEIKGDKVIGPLEDALKHDDVGTVRNEAAVALGKIKGEKVINALVDALKRDKYETTRKSAAIGLREVKFEAAVNGLVDVLKGQAGKEEEKRETEAVLNEIITALIKDGAIASNKNLLSALTSSDETVRERAANALGNIANVNAVDNMTAALKDDSVIVRAEVAALLGKFKQRKTVQSLIDVLNDKAEWKSVRAKAAASLGTLRDEAAIGPLLDALKDENAEIRASAAAALGNLKDVRAVEPLIEIVNNPLISPPLKGAGGISEYVFSAEGLLYSPVRNNAIVALGKIGDSRAEPVLIKIAQNEIGIPQRSAITALGNLASKNAVPTLIEILQNREADPTSRINAATALGKIGDRRAAKPLEKRLLDGTEYNITVIDDKKHNKFWQAVANAIYKSFQISGNDDEKLISRLYDPWEHDPVRIAAAKALGRTGTPEAIEKLKDTLANDTVEGVRQAAALALGKTKRKDLVPLLVKVMKDTSKAKGDRRGATQGLGEIADPSTVDDLAGIMRDTSVAIEIRRDAAVSLGKIGNNAAVSALISELKKDGIDKNLKLNIISALGTAKSQAAVDELKLMLKDEDSDIHFTAADSLFQITGDGHGYNLSYELRVTSYEL